MEIAVYAVLIHLLHVVCRLRSVCDVSGADSEQRLFNTSGEIIACPILSDSVKEPLHILISTTEVEGYVQCEKLALLDLSVRGYKKINRIRLEDKMNIADAIQGIFEYL